MTAKLASHLVVVLLPDGPIGWDGKDPSWSEGEGYYLESIAKRVGRVDLCTYAFLPNNEWYRSVSHYKFLLKNIRYLILPQTSGHRPGITKKMLQLLNVLFKIRIAIKQADIVYVFIPSFPSILAVLWATIYRKPFVVYAASDWSKEESALMFRWIGLRQKLFFPLYSQINLCAERFIISRAVFTLCAGRQAKNRFCQWSDSVYETIPRLNWPAVESYSRVDTCTGKNIRMLYVGGLYHRKGIRWMIEAMAILKTRSNIEFKLLIVGDGDQRTSYEKLCENLDITESVEFLGHVQSGPALFRLYRESDIFVFPSLGEGFPRVLYEAMAYSLPVIATNVNSIPLIMPHAERAILVPPQDAVAIADATIMLSKNAEVRRRLITSGYDFMQKILLESDGGHQFVSLLKRHKLAFGKDEDCGSSLFAVGKGGA